VLLSPQQATAVWGHSLVSMAAKRFHADREVLVEHHNHAKWLFHFCHPASFCRKTALRTSACTALCVLDQHRQSSSDSTALQSHSTDTASFTTSWDIHSLIRFPGLSSSVEGPSPGTAVSWPAEHPCLLGAGTPASAGSRRAHAIPPSSYIPGWEASI